jgi:hypothetical protein
MWDHCTANNVARSLTNNGFSCKRLNADELQNLLCDPTAEILDPSHWNVRSHRSFTFGPETTDEEAAEITRLSRAGIAEIAWLPQEDIQIAYGIMLEAGRNAPSAFHSILGLACNEWKEKFGESRSLPLTEAENRLFYSYDTGVREIFRKLLSQTQSDYARVGELFEFVDFLKLFLRYGRTDGLLAGLKEITTDRGTLIPGLAVREWIPNLSEHLRILGAFVIVEGDAPGTFQLIVMAENVPVGLEIVVDPSSEQERFSVMIEDTMAHVATWESLFEKLVQTTVGGVKLSSRIEGCHPPADPIFLTSEAKDGSAGIS